MNSVFRFPEAPSISTYTIILTDKRRYVSFEIVYVKVSLLTEIKGNYIDEVDTLCTL